MKLAKFLKFELLSAWASLLLFIGCSITREAVLGEGKARGSINYPPVFLTEGVKVGSSVVSTRFESNMGKTLTESVNSSQYSNTVMSRDNLSRDISIASGGLGLELPTSDNFSFIGSVSLSKDNYPKGSVRLSICSKSESLGFRLDGGLLFNQYSYDVHSYVEETTTLLFWSNSNTIFYHDKGVCSSNNIYISLTLNSINEDRLVNLFMNSSYFGQTIPDYNPGNFDEGVYFLVPYPIGVINNNTNLKYTSWVIPQSFGQSTHFGWHQDII